MTSPTVTSIEEITDEGIIKLLENGVHFDIPDSERLRLGEIMKKYDKDHEKRMMCEKCGSQQFYGVEQPPVPWGLNVTVWTIYCDNCNHVVLVKSNYD